MSVELSSEPWSGEDSAIAVEPGGEPPECMSSPAHRTRDRIPKNLPYESAGEEAK